MGDIMEKIEEKYALEAASREARRLESEAGRAKKAPAEAGPEGNKFAGFFS